MDSISLKMTYDRCQAILNFIESSLIVFEAKTTNEKLVECLMWKVRNRFRAKTENNRDTSKCNVSLELPLALAYHDYFTNHCPLVSQPYPGATINQHVEIIDKKYG